MTARSASEELEDLLTKVYLHDIPIEQAKQTVARFIVEMRHAVVEAERDACAKVCADYAEDYREKAAGTTEPLLLGAFRHRSIAACDCEVAIRARNKWVSPAGGAGSDG
jgi:hypothetical protein